jgi:isopentenyl diphosphate isomerase/L-lactate dehydrogenase-like FMN-dependent dehydrogenase
MGSSNTVGRRARDPAVGVIRALRYPANEVPTLLQLIRAQEKGMPLVASGGIATGGALAAVLTAGASAVRTAAEVVDGLMSEARAAIATGSEKLEAPGR